MAERESIFTFPQNDWKDFFEKESKKEYFIELEELFLNMTHKKVFFPKKQDIFKAFELTPIKNIRVVMLGQDPYPGRCKKTNEPFACGLSFSTNKRCIDIPGSLKNIYKEIENSGFEPPEDGDLEYLVRQGVFLLNRSLTLEEGKSNSHRFWMEFTRNAIKYLVSQKPNLYFLLFGAEALKIKNHLSDVDTVKYLITSHPSGFSFNRKMKGYPSLCGSRVFETLNNMLEEDGEKPINWGC